MEGCEQSSTQPINLTLFKNKICFKYQSHTREKNVPLGPEKDCMNMWRLKDTNHVSTLMINSVISISIFSNLTDCYIYK